ncbi:MAG TPA: right-handed parallel beta-helix repeat-containing protein, partial [Catalimonadaceae bacterium]|nr:right-handed parallel beta-helix repeat-containing protein [Catalimonadaceae bacterium]
MKTYLKSLMLITATGCMISCSKETSTSPDPTPTPKVSNILKGTISSDLTLLNGGAAVDYYLEDIVKVEARLTIEPGTVIVAKAGAGLEFSTAKGTIKAEGTAAKPIVIKSESDTKGGWLGIKFQDSNSPLNVMRHVTVTDGGSASFDGDESKKATIQFAGINQLKMKNCTVSNSANWGLYETVTSNLTLIEFDSNTFSNHTGFPIYIFDATAKSLGSKSTFSGNAKSYIGLMQKSFDGLNG